MEQKEIRLLTADEIDVRVAQTTNYNGEVKVSLLLYKDARVDMKILDELYGPMGWKRTHQLIGDRLYCTIEVKDNATGEWIAKQDVGTESNTEPEKGQASDAFKRAGFNWGIGRELYTAPKISVALNPKEYRDNGGRIQVYATFRVAEIAYDAERNINRLTIVDKNGTIRYELGKARTNTATAQLTASQFKAMVEKYAKGEKTRNGGDIRETWIINHNPSDAEVEKFDQYVDEYRSANL